MIILTLILILAIAIIALVLLKSKSKERFDGEVKLETVTEVAKLINLETYISDHITIYTTRRKKEKDVAILKIDCKVVFEYDIRDIFKEEDFDNNSNIISLTKIEDPKLTKIETIYEDKHVDKELTSTRFVGLERGIKLNRAQIESCERAYLNDFQNRPKTKLLIEKSKEKFVDDVNMILQTLGSTKKVEYTGSKADLTKYAKLSEAGEEGNFRVKIDDVETDMDAKILKEGFKVLVCMANVDENITPEEKKYILDLLKNSNFPEDTIDELIKNLENGKEYSKNDINFDIFRDNHPASVKLVNDLYDIAIRDDQFDKSEMDFLKDVSKKLKVKNDEVDFDFDLETSRLKNIFRRKGKSSDENESRNAKVEETETFDESPELEEDEPIDERGFMGRLFGKRK